MDSVLRGAAIYFFLMVIFRLSGKRALSQVTTFDFVLLLIISETTQQGLLGDDFSITNGCLLITTPVGLDVGLHHPRQDMRASGRAPTQRRSHRFRPLSG